MLGIWPKNRAARRFLLLGVALVITTFYIHARLNAPNNSSVNGTYYNKCCGDIVLRDGEVIYKGIRTTYDLENMKFGLTAYVPGQFTENGFLPPVQKSFFALDRLPDQTLFLFYSEGGKQGFSTSSRNYFFVKKN